MPDEPKFVAVGLVRKCSSDPKYAKDRMRYPGEPTMKQIAAAALGELEAARAKDVAQHEINLPIMAANALAREEIVALMKRHGVADTYTVSELKPRARYSKMVTYPAGYIGDMQRNLPTNDGFEFAMASYNSLKATYDKYAAEAEKEDERLQAQKERDDNAKKAKRRADIELAEILIRYSLDIDMDWPQVLEALRMKDKHFDLAVAMSQTRGDWSEGFYRVSDAVGRYTLETEEDKNILADVLGCMAGDEDDGRIFRDTTYSYDVLFAMGDQQLSADVRKAMNHSPSY